MGAPRAGDRRNLPPSTRDRRTRHRRPSLALLSLVAAPLAFGACTLDPPEERELQVEVVLVDGGAMVGDTLDFVVEAEGPGLLEVRVHFGDGAIHVREAQGAVMLREEIEHVYEEEAVYQVRGEAEALDGAVVEDLLSVEVGPDPAG